MNDVNPFDMLVAEISGTGGSQYRGMVHPMMLRLNVVTYAGIAAMADMAADSSRNAVANNLLEAALSEVTSRLDEDTRLAFHDLQGKHLRTALESKDVAAGSLESGKRGN